jgi:hypothetical protein
MALTSAEEALVRELLAQQAALIALASNEATITSKLGAEKATLSDLAAASSVADSDLLLIRQGATDKSVTALTLGAPFRGDDGLEALVGLTPAADRFPYFTGTNSSALATITAAARALLDDGNYATMRATLGAQAQDADLDAIAALTTTTYGRTLLTLADAAAGRFALGLGGAAVRDDSYFTPTSGSNGQGNWIVFPFGLIVQFGEGTAGETSSPPSINFPIPFTDFNRMVVFAGARSPNPGASSGNKVGANKVSLTQYNLHSDDGNQSVFWIALGY